MLFPPPHIHPKKLLSDTPWYGWSEAGIFTGSWDRTDSLPGPELPEVGKRDMPPYQYVSSSPPSIFRPHILGIKSILWVIWPLIISKIGKLSRLCPTPPLWHKSFWPFCFASKSFSLSFLMHAERLIVNSCEFLYVHVHVFSVMTTFPFRFRSFLSLLTSKRQILNCGLLLFTPPPPNHSQQS